MAEAQTHKHWCADHKSDYEDSCFTQVVLYDNNEDEATQPAKGSLAAQFQAMGGSKDIAWVQFVASHDVEEDDQPLTDLQFFTAWDYEALGNLHLSIVGLRELHSNLGDVLKRIS
ncbi:hypothetical protein [Arthrobacter sp. 260]|uniref:hypothetical protein n=1 Tax=Arthrobacter sp. 260 TaxID=2735314 RepID=UPI001490EA47|nr:hypothetical protein [Arthrobacter sp. 260]NOJ60004.1 hypothetical protein [Arthrobacter sp. 260]